MDRPFRRGRKWRPPRIVKERWKIERIGGAISGYAYAEGIPKPIGVSPIQTLVSRAGDWLEGFCTWYDLSSNRIECSKMIPVRRSPAFPERYLDEARRWIGIEMELFKRGRLGELDHITEIFRQKGVVKDQGLPDVSEKPPDCQLSGRS